MISDLNERGFAIMRAVIEDAEVVELQSAFAAIVLPAGNQTFALRNILRTIPAVRALATSKAVRSLVEPVLGVDCFAVRAIYFDKLPGMNWKVPWHQDLSVAVAYRDDVEGFGPWSVKGGVVHAQAPVAVLERMLTVRLHLDACDLTNGPLRILPGTHRHGKMDQMGIEHVRLQGTEVSCEIERGGALLIRPLLLHASSAAQSPHHRRVIHIEYADGPLPNGLQWHDAVFPCRQTAG